MSNPRENWTKCGDRFYRKIQLYTSVFDPDLELENYTLVGAPYSGAIALYRDKTKVHSFRGASSTKPTIDIYTCAGTLITRINWDKGEIRGLGWSEDEKLIVVSQDGTVRVYRDLQGDFDPFTLGHSAEEYGVQSCKFWSSGFVALLGNNQLVAVTRYNEPRPSVLASPPSDEVVSWAIIPPAFTLSRSVEALLAIGKSIMTIDASEAEDRMLQNGPFRHVSVSPNGKFVAVYTEDGKVWVVTSDFQNRLSEYDSKVKTPPRELQWCGNNAVLLLWEDEIHLVGPNGAASKFYYDSFVHLVPDLDGTRVFTNEVCEFMQRVPDESEEVFKLGSTSPSSILLDALDHLEKRSPKADDNIQLIRPHLDEAVYTCVRAAGHEYAVHWQKQLLKAASFGKSVIPLFPDVDDFVEMTETLRVLNAGRYYEIGMPITCEQYMRLTPERLVQRLINRSEYLLALKVSEFMRLPIDKIYVHWARQKVRKSTDDEETICRDIVEKLKTKRGISFEEIARAAYDEGRGGLAVELLEHEPRAGKQVPILLNVEEDARALDKAIESGDTDLVYHVLLHLKNKLPLASFFRTINSRPVATALVESSAIDQDQELLKDLFYQDDRRLDGSNLLVTEAIQVEDPTAKIDKLKSAARILQDSKEHAFQVKAISEAQVLLKMQEAFENDLNEHFSGLSVNDTIYKLIRLGNIKRSQKVQSEFKVTDKIYWWIRLRALVSRRDWKELEEIGKVKKSPIGWEPFFSEILSAGNAKLASTFVPKCTNLTMEERTELWEKCGMLNKAGEEALKAKNMALLQTLRGKATGQQALDIDRMIAQLSRR
ncbi:Vps16, N-terminal region-domain-containing protein [Elsinoe ampelina]|uniref:Probable vacuolar protein sorting-associated protein 16 homolog n=1 Tax=Elsinoe ampelina TaxID=302913 RepID=A0A6A6GJP0_9PEZI|nr:Vps16, N-terminal region-domain-containing protein [Elsinoe ampelina]